MPIVISAIAQLSTDRDELILTGRELVSRPQRLDPLCLAGVVAAGCALTARCVDLRLHRHAVVLGTGLGCLEADYDYYGQVLEHGLKRTNPRAFAYTLPNVVLGEVAIAFGLAGEQLAVSAGRASGLTAVVEAAALVEADRADLVMVLAIDVVGPGTRALFGAAGTQPEPCVTALMVERAPTGLARIVSADTRFDPEAALPDPTVDPLGCAGIPTLCEEALARRPAVVEARCPSGHVARVSVSPK